MQEIRVSGRVNEVACCKFPTNVPSAREVECELPRGGELFNRVVCAVEFPSTGAKGGRLGSGNAVHRCWTT